uniref:beta strand repeat-containing protein n=1 Tax=Methanobrevibacter arboriphilus TaxID=39441 RepID=UPI000AAE56C5
MFSLSSVSAGTYDLNSSNTTGDFQNIINNDAGDELIINLDDDGNYTLGQINVTRNATIQGKNRNVNISGSGVLFNITAPNVRIVNLTITGFNTSIVANSSDLTVTGNNIITTNVSINISSSGGDLKGIVIEDNVIVSYISNSNYGAVFVNVPDDSFALVVVSFVNNKIYLNGTSNYPSGVRVNARGSSSNLTFTGNNITGTYSISLYGVYLDAYYSNYNNITFTDNNITGTSSGSRGVNLGAYSSNNTNITFTNNNITGTYGVYYINDNNKYNNITFTDNNIKEFYLYAPNCDYNNITFTDNNITGFYLDAYSGNYNNITFTDNNITELSPMGVNYNNNLNIAFANNRITGGEGTKLNVYGSNYINITFTDNFLVGGASLNYAFYLNAGTGSNYLNIIVTKNNIIGGGSSVGAARVDVTNGNYTNLTFTDNIITGGSFGPVHLIASETSNANINFTDNIITGLIAVSIDAYNTNNLNITCTDNNITGTDYGVNLLAYSNNNLNISFVNNNITSAGYGVYSDCYTDNLNGVSFLNNTINSTGGDGFYFCSYHYEFPVSNITDFIIRGNNIIAHGVGLNFADLKVGSRVNVTVEYNRIIAPVGVKITNFNDNSSFNFNWWGVNNITGKVLGVDTLNHYILNITNTTSLDGVHPGGNVSFMLLVLNTTLSNDGVEFLPDFVVNGTFNGDKFNSSRDDGFVYNATATTGTQTLAATLDNVNDNVVFNVQLATNSTIIVNPDPVSIGNNVTISGQLDNFTGIASVNVTIDGITQSVSV